MAGISCSSDWNVGWIPPTNNIQTGSGTHPASLFHGYLGSF